MKAFGRNVIACLSVGALLAGASLAPPHALAQTTVTVAVTSDFTSRNPYGDTTAQTYGMWCQVYGCLGAYDPAILDATGVLAKSWEIDKSDQHVWIVHLKQGLKRHGDGVELTAADVVHSIWRTKHDPRSQQAGNIPEIKSAEAADKYTVSITTHSPMANLPMASFEQLIITAKDLHDKHGGERADRQFPLGWGPYKLKELVIGQRMVLEKNLDWPGIKPRNPDRLIFLRVPEAEARVTGLLNGEIQVAQTIPPHLITRLDPARGVEAKSIPSYEGMFLGMNSKFPPWDNKLVRQAAAYAIDRNLIMEKVLRGYASLLHGPVGDGQFGYTPDLEPKYSYDPRKARELLEKSGQMGVEVELSTTTNRFMYDVQTAEAIKPMLEAVGFKVKLLTPEYATQFAAVQRGNRSLFYHGRGTMMDPSAAMAQMFQTGVTPRIRYSNPEFDKIFSNSLTQFDKYERRKSLQKAFAILQEDVPAFWLWRINILYGVDTKKIDFTPLPHNRVYGTDIIVR